MSLRTTSTANPARSRWQLWPSMGTLSFHDLENGLDKIRVAVQHRTDGPSDLPFLEPVAAPIRLLDAANGSVQGQRPGFPAILRRHTLVWFLRLLGRRVPLIMPISA